MRLAELADPPVVGMEDRGQKITLRHNVVHHEADAGIDHSRIHAIGIHVLHVFFRNVSPRTDVFETGSLAKVFRVLKPHPGLGANSEAHHLAAIAEPPVAFLQGYDLWCAVLELATDSIRPQVSWLNDVAIR